MRQTWMVGKVTMPAEVNPPITLEEAKSLKPGTWLYHRILRGYGGRPMRAKVIGKPKVWKRDTGRVELSMKHGLYTFFKVSEAELSVWSLHEGGE